MNTENLVNSNLQRLANRMECDIRQQGLVPGAPYLTAAKAAEYLGVSRMTANRALNVLAEQQILLRHRNHGTFVGPGIEQGKTQEAGHLFYLSFADVTSTLILPVGKMVSGLRRAMPDVTLQQHFASPKITSLTEALGYARQTIETACANPMCKGIIASLCVREVQQILAECGLPVVLFGSVYPGIDLPSVDVDQKQCGRLLAKRAIAAGFKNIIFVNSEIWCRGNTLLFNGILEVVQESDLGSNVLSVQNLSQDEESAQAEVDYIMSQNVKTPTAVLSQSLGVAQAIIRAMTRSGVLTAGEVQLFYSDDVNSPSKTLPSNLAIEPTVQCSIPLEDQFEIIGQMMTQLREKQPLESKQFIVPVQ